jgi:hypothetical protein
LDQTQKVIFEVFLVGGKVIELLEGGAESGKVGIVTEDLAFHSVGIAERYALEIGEQIEICGD